MKKVSMICDGQENYDLRLKKHHKKNIWTDFEEQKFITGETDQKIVNLLCPEVYI